MSNVPCQMYLSNDPVTQLPNDPISGSVGRLTNTSDMGHWTSQHLSAREGATAVHHRRLKLQELRYLGWRHTPLRADFLSLQITRFKARNHVGFGHAQRLCSIRRTHRFRYAGYP